MEDCPDFQAAADYKSSFLLKLVLLCQTVANILTIHVVVKCMFEFRSVYFHPNCKVLVRLLLIGFILHGVSLSIDLLYHVYSFTYHPVCQIALPSSYCILFKSVPYSCMFMFSAVHVFLSFERMIAKVFVRRYERMNCFIGVIFVFLSIAAGILLYCYTIRNDDLSVKRSICAMSNEYIIEDRKVTLYAQLLMDFISTTILGVLYAIERLKKGGLQHRLDSFDLSAAFQSIEHRQATSMMLPMTIFHCISYTIFELVMLTAICFVDTVNPLTLRILRSAAYLIPFYTLFSGLLLLRLMRKFQSERRTRKRVSLRQVYNVDDIRNTYAECWK